MQIPLFKPQTEWLPPENFPDLSKYDEIAIDLETKDPDLMKTGSGSVVGKGDVVGIAVAVAGWSGYYPIALISHLWLDSILYLLVGDVVGDLSSVLI